MKMKKATNIYMFCHYAQQPPYNTALRYHNWGKILVSRGYSVTIFCASVVHNTDIDVIDELGGMKQSSCDGVKYVYVKTSKYSGNGLGRIKNMIQYYHNIKMIAKRFPKPDLSLCCCAYLYKRAKSIWKDVPCICDIEDLWPESIVDVMNISANNPMIKYLYHVEKEAYKKCDALVFSVAGGYEYITDKGWQNLIDEKKVFHINMGVDLDEFDKNVTAYTYDDSRLLQDDIFKVVYCGSVRAANNIKALCDAAKIVKNQESSIQFMIHGSGNEVEELTQYCLDNQIDNVKFYGRIDKNQIPYVLSHADVCLLTFADISIKKYGGSQQKSFEYYASRKPIVSNWDSGYNLIKEYNAGIVSKTQSPEDMAKAILDVYNMTDEQREQMGKNARQIAEDYAQPKLVNQLINVMNYVSKN